MYNAKKLSDMCRKRRMAKGGKVDDYRATGTGVHESNHEGPGNSVAGSHTKSAHKGNTSFSKDTLHAEAKSEHRRVLGEMKADKGDRRNLAKGGCPTCGR